MDPIIVIGSGLAGYTVASEYRKLDKTRQVILVTRDNGDFYSKPMLSIAFAQKKSIEQLINTHAHTMVEQLDLTLLGSTDVYSIDGAARQIVTSKGSYSYGALVLALGADPFRLQMAGTGAADVLSVNDLVDYARFRAKIQGAWRVLIVGAGLIGCEFANDLIHGGIRPTVVDPAAYPLSTFVPELAGRALQRGLAVAGVDWCLGATVSTVDQAEKGYRVTLADGTAIEADAVLSAVGLRPRVQLAKDAGIRAARGITVDHYARTSAPDVYALGDCAEYAAGVLPFVRPVMVAAKSIAATLAGIPTKIAFPHMPVAVKTPAHPVAVHKPRVGVEGEWHVEDTEEGVRLLFKDSAGAVHGFVASGKHAQQRLAMAKLLTA